MTFDPGPDFDFDWLPQRQGSTATVSRRRRACCWNLFFSRRVAGAQRLFFKTIHAAGDSGSHDFFPEVQQVAELAAGQLQVRLNLLFVGRCHPFDRFEFQYHPALNDQVRPEAFVKLDALVRDRHRHLPNDLQPALRQLASQNDLVNRLKVALTEGPSLGRPSPMYPCSLIMQARVGHATSSPELQQP
jgi:hypothetical protein